MLFDPQSLPTPCDHANLHWIIFSDTPSDSPSRFGRSLSYLQSNSPRSNMQMSLMHNDPTCQRCSSYFSSIEISTSRLQLWFRHKAQLVHTHNHRATNGNPQFISLRPCRRLFSADFVIDAILMFCKPAG
ncbi:Uncharacterized protein HZ326_1588 [Fusarium oxysporum f. sp. albedinis]|nr:Uncharacterized protein HZ326_1588 [Fusarium oxysporum f. sp. albedinis]